MFKELIELKFNLEIFNISSLNNEIHISTYLLNMDYKNNKCNITIHYKTWNLFVFLNHYHKTNLNNDSLTKMLEFSNDEYEHYLH